ncbi:DUF4386 domain-containing protein [Actinophytocola sp.]|uniref:DUF4386 domain-containing protein n=1 Tax=Actinophytocola sp. TaxID=1872138 RepID=UPI002D7FD67E|nr:DUF4386 domain-containing protein [Actinophytocola sp.]HET9138771.1 DUF4386 domain-containing protein [Actinophytocola sp.]
MAGDPAATLANLVERETLARAGVAFELLVVVTIALAAAFGLVNAVAILSSAAMLATVQLLYLLSANLGEVGALLFGLWLIPMGWCVLRSGWMPRALGWVLIAGGAAYLLSAFVRYLLPGAQGVADALTLPATVGEVWMVGYLLGRGLTGATSLSSAPVR